MTQTWTELKQVRPRLATNRANIVTLISAAVMLFAVLFTTPWVDQTQIIRSQLEARGIELPEGFDVEQMQQRMAERMAQGGSFPSANADSALSGLQPFGESSDTASGLQPFGGSSDTASGAQPFASANFGAGGQIGGLGASQDGLAQLAPYLIAIGALIAAGMAVWDFLKPVKGRRYLVPALIAAGGVIALLYYGYFFLVQNPTSQVDLIGVVTPGFWIALAGTVGLFVQMAVPRPVTTTQPARQPARQPMKATDKAGKSGVSTAPKATEVSVMPKAPKVAAAPKAAEVPVPPRAPEVSVIPKAPKAAAAPKAAEAPTVIHLGGGAGINLLQNLGVAFDALMANKLRSALTMLGIIIGVAAVVSLISVGQSASASITNRIEGAGANVVSIRSRSRTAQYALTLSDVEALESRLSHVVAVAPSNSLQATVKFGDVSVTVSVTATTAAYAEVNVLEMNLGRFLNDDDQASKERVAVLGSQTAEDLFGGLNPIGESIRINNVRFEVVGVAADSGSGATFGDPDSVVYVPLSTASRRLYRSMTLVGSEESVSTVALLADSSEVVSQVIDGVEALLRDLHDILPDEDLPYGVFSASTLLETVESVYNTLTVFLGAIAGISLFVGGIGIMNITLVSVTERTKEIGLRKAVGAQRVHILAQFLIETVVLSTTGGVIGILVSGGIMLLVNSSGLMSAWLSPMAVALGFGFSVLVGMFFGLYPANRAARLQPIEALRYE